MLFSQNELAELPAKLRWGHSAISHILSKFENEAEPRTAFPCMFARNAVKRRDLRFLLIPYEPENSRYELNLLASGLRTYVDQINIDALDINHNRSLLVLFEPVATLMTTDQFKKYSSKRCRFYAMKIGDLGLRTCPRIPRTALGRCAFTVASSS